MSFKKPPIPLKNAGMYDLCKTANKLTRQLIALCIWTHIPSIQDHITDMRRLHPPSQAQSQIAKRKRGRRDEGPAHTTTTKGRRQERGQTRVASSALSAPKTLQLIQASSIRLRCCFNNSAALGFQATLRQPVIENSVFTWNLRLHTTIEVSATQRAVAHQTPMAFVLYNSPELDKEG